MRVENNVINSGILDIINMEPIYSHTYNMYSYTCLVFGEEDGTNLDPLARQSRCYDITNIGYASRLHPFPTK